ncbi:MAG TPA: hypothetical protein VFN44_02925, partial [Solirubrobacteraceae bacterium]|nr:hypothetical protein [Solirubrobacteraceae bacterium]
MPVSPTWESSAGDGRDRTSSPGAATRLASGAMRLALRPLTGALATAGRLERRARSGAGDLAGEAGLTIVDAVVGSPYTERAVDHLLESPLAERAIARALTGPLVDAAARTLEGPELERIATRLVESPGMERLVTRIVDSSAM